MLQKFIQVLIFACFWLCFVPWLVILLNHHNAIAQGNLLENIIQYTTLFFVLILVYWLIKTIFDHLYTRQQIKKRVRKITIRQQLQRLERGEIDIKEAQDIRTFTKASVPKAPKAKRSSSCKRPDRVQEMRLLNESRPASPAGSRKSGKNAKPAAPTVPVSTDLPAAAELPPYTEDMLLLEKV